MKFTTLLSAIALGVASTLVDALPVKQARDIWDPKMTYPTNGTVWTSGSTYTVTWETADAPAHITGEGGAFILLRIGDYETSVVLAHDIDLRDGKAEVTAPEVITGDNFSLVLFGDSGNWGDMFTIVGPVAA